MDLSVHLSDSIDANEARLDPLWDMAGPAVVTVTGQGPFRLRARATRAYPTHFDFRRAAVLGAEFYGFGTERQMANWHVDGLYLPTGDLIVDGGREDKHEGPYEALYSFAFERTTIDYGRIVVRGAAFESAFLRGRVSAPPNTPAIRLEHRDVPQGNGKAVVSSIRFSGMTVWGGRGIYSDVGDSHFDHMTILKSEGHALTIPNNISGSVTNCHLEAGNLLEAGPALKMNNTPAIQNVLVYPGKHTTHAVDVYAVNPGYVIGGHIEGDLPYLKTNSLELCGRAEPAPPQDTRCVFSRWFSSHVKPEAP